MSLFTKSQSPISSDGIMLPDGMRYASMKNVRRKRKIASVPATDLVNSQSLRGLYHGFAPRPRAAATTFSFLGLSADFFLAATGGVCCGKRGRIHSALDAPPS